MSLASLCRTRPVEIASVQKLIHSGELSFVKSSLGKNQNERLWVHLKSTLEKALGISEPMDVNEVASDLRLNVNLVPLLAHTGTLSAHAHPWRGGTYYAFARKEVEAFRQKYIFPGELAERGIPIGSVRVEGKVAHATWRTAPVRLYLRCEAERAA